MNFKVIAHLDGRGIYFDPAEPIHIDALLVFSLARFHSNRHISNRDDIPVDIPLPLMRGNIDGHDIWRASVLLPDGGSAESNRFWRKRFRVGMADLTSGSPNTQNGIYRDYSMPVPLLLVPRLVGYASGNRAEVQRLLTRNIRSLGKKRAHGLGRVIKWECVETDTDNSWVLDGCANRFLPDPTGYRSCRVAPPYWCSHGMTKVCEIGDKYTRGDAK